MLRSRTCDFARSGARKFATYLSIHVLYFDLHLSFSFSVFHFYLSVLLNHTIYIYIYTISFSNRVLRGRAILTFSLQIIHCPTSTCAFISVSLFNTRHILKLPRTRAPIVKTHSLDSGERLFPDWSSVWSFVVRHVRYVRLSRNVTFKDWQGVARFL